MGFGAVGSVNPASRVEFDLAALSRIGVHLIEASAGTGKTHTITSLVLSLIAEHGLKIEQVLAVTFTNAAAAELKERIAHRLSSALAALVQGEELVGDQVITGFLHHPERALLTARLSAACREVDGASVFTIHGFAARVLRDFPLETGTRPDLELLGDQRALILDVATDFWVSRIATLPLDEFQAIGAPGLSSHLLSVARLAGSSFDVAHVPVEVPKMPLSATIAEFSRLFARVRPVFLEQGRELLELLRTSAALNRQQMKVSTLSKEYAACLRYLHDNEPSRPAPEFARLTLSKVAGSLKKSHVAPTHPLLELLDELYKGAEGLRLRVEAFKDELSAELAANVQAKLRAEHQRQGTQSFDSLLSELCLALRDARLGPRLATELRRRFPVALIDEFQDTDLVQYEIFQRIYADAPLEQGTALYLIGDPKQSIYAFRGADIHSYLRAKKATPGPVLTLTTSYRASPALVAAQNHLFGSRAAAFGLDEIVYDPIVARPGRTNELFERGAAAPGLRVVFSEESSPDWLGLAAQEIAALLDSGLLLCGRPVSPSDIAVLTRRNVEAIQLQRLLAKLGIAAVMHGDRSVFETLEALEIREVLLTLAQPKKRGALRSALATTLFGLNAVQIAALDEDIAALEHWSECFDDYARLWRTRGFARCFAALFAEQNVVSRILTEDGGERRLTNLRHLIELLQDAEASQHLGMFGLIRFIEDAIFQPNSHAMAPEARQLRLESDDQAVVLTTAHKSKGLEYNIVVLPVLGRGDSPRPAEAYRYHDTASSRSFLELRGDKSETRSLYVAAELQEGMRLAYVALTRARHQVVTFVGSGSGYSPLRYLAFSHLLGTDVNLATFFDRHKELKEFDLWTELVRWAEQSGTSVVAARPRSSNTFRRSPATPKELLLSPPSRKLVVEGEATSSFSSMTRTQHLSQKSREGRAQVDSDAQSWLQEGGGPASSLGPCALATFPRGARPGEALHRIFELSPFHAEMVESRREIVGAELRRSAISEAHSDAVHRAFEDVLRVELPHPCTEGTFRLNQISEDSKFCEMEFNLIAGCPARPVSPSRLANALKDVSPEYAKAVGALHFDEFSGFLRGFIDLVFMEGERIFALDYKSNHLGERYVDYGPSAVLAAMERHHYLLQAIVYSVALHSYAKVRIPEYEYDRHFGGMYYLFVRGMHPSLGAHGVFAFRPSLETLERVSELFFGGSPDERGENT